MKEFFVNITFEHQIKGEHLLVKAFKNLKPGRYRCELYNTTKRSLNQNAYEHVCYTLAQKGLYDQGYSEIRTMEDAKEFYKKLFLSAKAVNEQTGEVYEYVRRTRDLDKEETNVLIEQVREHCLEWTGVYIPSPDEWRAAHGKYDLVGLTT